MTIYNKLRLHFLDYNLLPFEARSQHASLEKDLTYTVFHDTQDGVQHVRGPLLKQVNVVALILDSMRERAPSL